MASRSGGQRGDSFPGRVVGEDSASQAQSGHVSCPRCSASKRWSQGVGPDHLPCLCHPCTRHRGKSGSILVLACFSPHLSLAVSSGTDLPSLISSPSSGEQATAAALGYYGDSALYGTWPITVPQFRPASGALQALVLLCVAWASGRSQAWLCRYRQGI